MATDRKSIISATWDKDAQTIVFGVLNVGTILLDFANLSEGLLETACFHGLEQKVRDAGAIPRDVKTGASASAQEKYDAMKEVVDNLHEGIWNVKGAGLKALNRAALFNAVAEVRGVDASVVEAKFRDRQDEVLRAFLTHKDIAGAYARLTSRDTGQADTLLAELE